VRYRPIADRATIYVRPRSPGRRLYRQRDITIESPTAAGARIAAITERIARQQPRVAAAERKNRELAIQEATHWQAIERLRRYPTEENARTTERAFLWLAKRHHPDQGTSHQGFLRVKDPYDRALAAWRRAAAWRQRSPYQGGRGGYETSQQGGQPPP
jgi:hypothetical protein